MDVLKTHRKELDLLADALLNYETLDGDEVKAVIGEFIFRCLVRPHVNLVMDSIIIWTKNSFEKLQNVIFFSRYSKFLPLGYWYRSRTSPKFFSKKNSNK